MNRRNKKTSKQKLSDKIHTWDIWWPWKYTSNKIGTTKATITVRANIMAPAGDVGPFLTPSTEAEEALEVARSAAGKGRSCSCLGLSRSRSTPASCGFQHNSRQSKIKMFSIQTYEAMNKTILI
jgi:hypothetical protein